MYSMRGLSKASVVLSGKTPSWLLLFFCPVEYAAIPGDESVIAALSDEVMTMPVTSSVSIARRPFAFPLCSPRDTSRAAVRCAMPMPSPSSRITFRADAAVPRVCQRFDRQPCGRANTVGGSRLDHERARHGDAEVAHQKIRRVRRSRARPVRRPDAGLSARAAGAALAAGAQPRGCCARDVLAVDEDRQTSRRFGPVRGRFDANIDPLTGREHAAVRRHDANPRLRRRRQDAQAHAQRSSNGRESHD